MDAIVLLELRDPSRLTKSVVRILMGLLLIWSFALRLWFATPDLDSTRFWDERYGLENLEPLLKHGQLRPVHGFHPGFSYLPHGLFLKTSDLIYKGTGNEKFAIFDHRGRYTPTTYLICRTLSVTFGTLSLFLLFLIGRQLGGDRLGLLAAFLLSVIPWHLRQSILFKADIALLFTVVLTFYLSLRAIQRPSWRSFAATGGAIGLALSAKFNAGPVALPLTLGAWLKRDSKWRAFCLLATAATVSIAVFLTLQPFVVIDPDIYRRSMGSTSRMYALWAAQAEQGRLYLFWHVIESLTSPAFHGPFIGALGILGLVSLTVLSFRQYRRSEVALFWIMVMTYVGGYIALYAIATPLASPHNWLPLTPFAALGAGWALLAIWLLATQRLNTGQKRVLGTSATLLLVSVCSWQASSYVYRETVPRTTDRALEVLRARLRRPPGRVVVSESDFKILFQTRHRLGRLAISTLDDLRNWPVDMLNWSDAEVFPAANLEDPEAADFYRSRVDRVGQKDAVIIEPALFKAWGPSLVTLVHPLREIDSWEGEWVRSDHDPRLFVAQLPKAMKNRARMSIEFMLPRTNRRVVIRAGERKIDVIQFRGPRLNKPATTQRFPAAQEVSMRLRKRPQADRIPFRVRTWRKARSSGRK